MNAEKIDIKSEKRPDIERKKRPDIEREKRPDIEREKRPDKKRKPTNSKDKNRKTCGKRQVYKCPAVGCFYSSVKKSRVTIHWDKRHKKPVTVHACHLCSCTFSQASNLYILARHRTKVHSGNTLLLYEG